MNPSLITVLQQQANYELFAAHSYEAIAHWCAAQDYDGFARFFFEQAAEEREHAKKFFDHLNDRGVAPVLAAVPAPENAFDGLPAVALKAKAMELANTEQILACHQTAVAEGELRSVPFLLEFIDEQVEEEAWTAKLLTLVERAQCAGALYTLDRHLPSELSAH